MGIVPVFLKQKTRNKIYRSERKLRKYFLNTTRFKISRGGTPRDTYQAMNIPVKGRVTFK
jgi:hypothetical protein